MTAEKKFINYWQRQKWGNTYNLQVNKKQMLCSGQCLASEEVIVHLISVKCLPVLTYGLDACPVCVSDIRSLDFIITTMFMKIFQTSSVDVVKDCLTMFNFRRVSELVLDRKRKFLQKLCSSDNIICETLAFNMAKDELSNLRSAS